MKPYINIRPNAYNQKNEPIFDINKPGEAFTSNIYYNVITI